MNPALWCSAYEGLDRLTRPREVRESLSPRQQQALALVRSGVNTARDLSRDLGVGRSATMDLLRRMERHGLLRSRQAAPNQAAIWEAAS